MQGVYLVYAEETPPDEALVAIPVEPVDEPEEEVAVEVVADSMTETEHSSDHSEEAAAGSDISVASDEQLPLSESPAEGAPDALIEQVVQAELSGSDDVPELATEVKTEVGSDVEDSSTDEPDVSGEESEALTPEQNDEATEVDSGGESGDGVDDISDPILNDSATTTASSSSEAAASSTELIGPAITTPVGVNYTDSGFMFSKNECTELASGSFYCLEPRENVLEDALFAAPDKDGDLEIFLVRNGAQTQVTDNFVDDAAPFFDQNSDTIVWHRLVDDRYQIVAYDLASGEEAQLTRGAQNNMEPIRQGKYTVWQRWVNNNWEIILYDGVKETQVSHASAHDIAPYIHGALVVWNRYGSTGEKTIEMYDIASETYVTVDDPEGMSVTNPRMVLVYDQMHPNGDIVTKGYDMIARRFIQLDTLPRELPDEIPGSEPTSETRALIQSKPTTKVDEMVEGEPPVGGEPPVPDLSATPSDPLTLDMSQSTTSVPVILDTTEPDLSQFDLIVPPLMTSEASTSAGVQT